MKTMKIKFFAFAFIGVIDGFAGAATVVHDAGYDLVLNSSSRAVYTNMYGGVWSFMRSTAWNGARTLMPAVRTRIDREDGNGWKTASSRTDDHANGLVMERGPAKGNASPCFAVNPTSIPDDNTFMRGAAFPLIPPGQISCHPGNTTDAGNQCIVLRFTMPRDGEYALNVKTWHQNTGKAGVTLLVNGAASAKGRVTSQGPSDGKNIMTNDFSLAAASYKAGDFVELAVDGNNTYNSNAMGFKFEVVETLDEVVEASEVFSGNLAAATPTNPVVTAVGSWEGDYMVGGVSTVSRQLLHPGYARTTQGAGLAGLGYRAQAGDALALPWIVVNDSDKYVAEVDGTGKPTSLQGRAIAPHEMVCHPDGDKTVGYRLTPESNGIYDIGLTMRDIAWTADSGQRAGTTVGVDVYLMQGCQTLAMRTVSTEGSPKMPGVSSGDSIYLPNVPVVANIPLEVVVYSRGGHNADSTAFRFALIRRGDFESAVGLSANAAMKANMQSATPAVSWTYGGANWKIGIRNGGLAGAFTPFTMRANARYNGHVEGFGNTAGTSPFVMVNMAGRTLSGAADGLENILGIGRDAIVTHPAASGGHPAVIRLEVPETGVYRATAWCKDVDASGSKDGNNGAAGYVFANGYVSGVKTFQSEGTSKDGNPNVPYARIEAGDLYLKAGEPLDFVVHERNTPYSDLTTVQAWAQKTGDGERYVGFDIDGHAEGQAAPPTYAGVGRIGFAESVWSSLKVENGAASAESPKYILDSAGVSVTARLTLSRVNGDIVATAANAADTSKAQALLQDGVISSGTNDVYTFTVSGLLPGETYTFWFYSRTKNQANPVVNGVFTIAGVSDASTHPWFTTSYGDYANLTAIADGDGCVSGTFASAKESSDACWCGLQVSGAGFHRGSPGLKVIVR